MRFDRYNHLIREVTDFGLQVPSRHGQTLEVIGHCYDDTDNGFPVRRGMSMALATVETLQILAGVFDISLLKKAAPNAQHGLFTEQMAYGPRLRNLFELAICTLREKVDSRQAVMLLNYPDRIGQDDLTCTLGIQFFYRFGTIDCSVFMRSWDLVKGLPYDLFFFQVAKNAVARCMGINAGALHVLASSVHIYVADLSRATAEEYRTINLPQDMPRDWAQVQGWAKDKLMEYRLSDQLPSFVFGKE